MVQQPHFGGHVSEVRHVSTTSASCEPEHKVSPAGDRHHSLRSRPCLEDGAGSLAAAWMPVRELAGRPVESDAITTARSPSQRRGASRAYISTISTRECARPISTPTPWPRQGGAWCTGSLPDQPPHPPCRPRSVSHLNLTKSDSGRERLTARTEIHSRVRDSLNAYLVPSSLGRAQEVVNAEYVEWSNVSVTNSVRLRYVM